MGAVKKLLAEIAVTLESIHNEIPRPTWEEAVSRVLVTFQFNDSDSIMFIDEDGPKSWCEAALSDIIEKEWDDVWEDET